MTGFFVALSLFVPHWHHTSASWYEGAYGACGHRLRGYYAAHKRMRCGALVEVCRHRRCVIVKIADRGPYIAGRELDLSKAAADQIGLTSLGVARVKYRRIHR